MKNDSVVLVDEQEVSLDGDDTSNDDIRIDDPFDPTQVRVDTKNYQMDALIKRMVNGEIDLAPDFQRSEGIWSDKAKSQLIESMLIRIPLPAFYMDASDDNKWLVVDGLQRLTAVNRFVIKKSFVLQGLEFLTEFDGSSFDDLPRSFQRRIEETDIVLYLIQPGTPSNVKFDIFRRINTGGEPLSPQEIRHALNQGTVTTFLYELAKSKEFMAATERGVSPKRMDDRECALRFLAFTLYSPDGYEKNNFDGFLNEAMAELNRLEQSKLDAYKKQYLQAMDCAKSIFGQHAFRKQYKKTYQRYPINKALFEAWSVNIGKLSKDKQAVLIRRKEDLVNRFLHLMNNDYEFEKSISQGTGSVRRVRYRFSMIAKIIEETLHD